MLPDRIFSAFQTASQGLAVQREKLSVASRNIANANTSAPKGSGAGYRPQSVRTSAPQAPNFKRVLEGSLSTLKQTDSKHLPAAGRSRFEPAGQHLGPRFEVTEQDNYRFEYDPGHPDADKNGMVRYPDIDMVQEMTRMVSANRLYEANLSSIEAHKQIIKRSLEI